MVVVVLGMHRSGTSLVANLLHNAMGVCMGSLFLGGGKGNPWGVWEDRDFFDLNRMILRRAAGAKGNHWHKPPSRESIRSLGSNQLRTDREVRALVHRKSKRKRWGWKDPRTCLTIEWYHKYLTDPYYVVTERSQAAIVASLERRAGQKKRGSGYWVPLIQRYEGDRDRFLKASKVQYIRIQYEKLVSRSAGYDEAMRLADFIGRNISRKTMGRITHYKYG